MLKIYRAKTQSSIMSNFSQRKVLAFNLTIQSPASQSVITVNTGAIILDEGALVPAFTVHSHFHTLGEWYKALVTKKQ